MSELTNSIYLNIFAVVFLREYVVDLDEGSQHLMRYRTIAPLVANGAVQLI